METRTQQASVAPRGSVAVAKRPWTPPGAPAPQPKVPNRAPSPFPRPRVPNPAQSRATEPSALAARPGRYNIEGADGFRGLAAIGVVLYHVLFSAGAPKFGGSWIQNILHSGYVGMDFFFVLSGFLLFLPVAQAKGAFGSVKAYTLRRAARILPAYYMAILASLALFPLLTKAHVPMPFASGQGSWNLLAHMTFLQHSLGLSMGWAEGFGVNGAFWTLSLEIVFYILLPLVAARYFRRPFVGLGIAVALATGWKLAVAHGAIPVPNGSMFGALQVGPIAHLILITQFPTYLAHFAVGMTAAWFFVKIRHDGIHFPVWSVVTVQVLAFASTVWGLMVAGQRDVPAASIGLGLADHWTATLPIAFSFAALLLATALAPRWAQWPVTNRVVKRLGDISYGTYLSHLLFIGIALTTFHWVPGGTWAFFRMGAFVVPGALLVGWVSYRWMERPILLWARGRSRKYANEAKLTPERDLLVPGHSGHHEALKRHARPAAPQRPAAVFEPGAVNGRSRPEAVSEPAALNGHSRPAAIDDLIALNGRSRPEAVSEPAALNGRSRPEVVGQPVAARQPAALNGSPRPAAVYVPATLNGHSRPAATDDLIALNGRSRPAAPHQPNNRSSLSRPAGLRPPASPNGGAVPAPAQPATAHRPAALNGSAPPVAQPASPDGRSRPTATHDPAGHSRIAAVHSPDSLYGHSRRPGAQKDAARNGSAALLWPADVYAPGSLSGHAGHNGFAGTNGTPKPASPPRPSGFRPASSFSGPSGAPGQG